MLQKSSFKNRKFHHKPGFFKQFRRKFRQKTENFHKIKAFFFKFQNELKIKVQSFDILI